MESNHQDKETLKNTHTDQDIMNRVNQTFEKITEDVKEMIHKNDDQLS